MSETTTTKTSLSLREGDVYRFRYSDEARQKWRTDPYWCFDGQVVFHKGALRDTYWGYQYGDARTVRPDEGDLTFVCNLHDVREIRDYEARHYDEADVFDLTHHHRHRKWFVVRKGAQPSAERILREIDIKERAVKDEMERAIRSGASDLVRLGELRALIKSGDLARKPWW